MYGMYLGGRFLLVIGEWLAAQQWNESESEKKAPTDSSPTPINLLTRMDVNYYVTGTL